MTKNTPRIFISLLLMLLCIGILPVSAFASDGDYPDDALPTAESSAADTQETKQIGTVTTNGGNLNVRTGAGLDNTAFTQLPNGTVVDVIGRDGDWVKILLPARVGYVYGSIWWCRSKWRAFLPRRSAPSGQPHPPDSRSGRFLRPHRHGQ